MRKEVHPSVTTKIIVALDVAATLAVEQVGMTYQLSAFHPLILGSVAGATYALLKHGDTISHHLVNMPDYAMDTFKKTRSLFEN
jgi:hypothetical protein